MGDDLRERLLASYADMGQAMVVQSVLEIEGIACRIADLGELPSHTFGMAGGLHRSVGLWVLEPEAERARSLLAELGSAEGAVDEEALAAEALAAPAAAGPAAEPVLAQPVRGRRLTADGRVVSRGLGSTALVILVVLATLAAVRGCA
ncbi:MAG: DUF2007 domain-containing protein [Deltaproteobacteria bacterium]|nr:DUF2007 domain-containing protein [Deltaproteobacteria bacterium]